MFRATAPIVIVLLAILSIFVERANAQASGNVEVLIQLSVEPVTSESRAVVLRATASNPTKTTVAVLTWGTPLEGLISRALSVTRDGKEIPYVGILGKRGEPKPADFLVLAPGEESVPVLIDLTRSYAVNAPGQYAVSLTSNSTLGYVAAAGISSAELFNTPRVDIALRSAQSPSFSVPERHRLEAPRSLRQKGAAPLALGFKNCTPAQKTDLAKHHSAAQTLAMNAVTYLDGNSAANPGTRYKTWFGVANSTRYDTVKSCQKKTKTDLAASAHTYHCDAGTGPCAQFYAWVDAGDAARNVHICPTYWSDLPSDEYGTQSGTVLHETTHYNAVCGTDDVASAYGKTGSKKLAKDDPDTAVDTADNHQYFAE